MEGVKNLELQRRRTRRRREGGTLTQSTDETGEIRLGTGTKASGCQPEVPGKGDTYKRSEAAKWWSAERKSEEVVVAVIGRGQHNPP